MSVSWGDRKRGGSPDSDLLAEESAAHWDRPIRDGEPCFYCMAALSYPVVMWHGPEEKTVYLHADCAAMFGSHLLSDWRIIKKGYDEYRQVRDWRSRALKRDAEERKREADKRG